MSREEVVVFEARAEVGRLDQAVSEEVLLIRDAAEQTTDGDSFARLGRI